MKANQESQRRVDGRGDGEMVWGEGGVSRVRASTGMIDDLPSASEGE